MPAQEHRKAESVMETTIGRIRERIEEFRRVRGDPGADPALVAEAALFIEEIFTLVLSDEEISSEQLGTGDAMERLVVGKLKAER